MDMKKRYIAFFFIIVVIVTIMASSSPFRFYPTHKIVKQVFCISCHTEEFEDLKIGRHIRMMSTEQNKTLYDYISLYTNASDPNYKTLIGSCYTCHVAYENFNLFGLTDPYVYPAGNRAVNTVGNMAVSETIYDAQYGTIVSWPWPYGNRAVEYYGTGNVAITTELSVLSVQPANVAIDSTIKVLLSNYSGQQNGSAGCDCTQILYQGDKQVINVGNIQNDYFSIILLLDGAWNSTTLNLTVSGTDKGTESFIINVSNPPIIYEAPKQTSGINYFKTNGTYRAVRLDAIWYAWRNVSVNGNITTSDTIQTSSPNGWINASTCSAPDSMCHIIQKATYIGMNDGANPDRSFYPHKMESVTSRQCKVCHLS
jgi:hypothetical protein